MDEAAKRRQEAWWDEVDVQAGVGPASTAQGAQHNLRGDIQQRRERAAPKLTGSKLEELLEATGLNAASKQLFGHLAHHSIAHDSDIDAMARAIRQSYGELSQRVYTFEARE